MRNKIFKETALKYLISEIGFTDATLSNSHTGDNYKSAIVMLFPYYTGQADDSNLSLYTRGMDYHIVIKEIFSSILNECKVSDYKIYSDIGPHIDIEMAYKAGLGYKGKNNLFINDKYGTYCFIGYAVCNEEFEYSKPLDKKCIGCNQCLSACPSGAISDNGFDCEKCISHITQTKGEHTIEQKKLIIDNKCIFGCDICQNVCPHNKDVNFSEIPYFTDNLINRLELSDIENLTNKEFNSIYGKRAFSWRGKGVLVRNLKYFDK